MTRNKSLVDKLEIWLFSRSQR